MMLQLNTHLLGESVCERLRKEQEEKEANGNSSYGYLPWVVAGTFAFLWAVKGKKTKDK